jgi:hypothetical protein
MAFMNSTASCTLASDIKSWKLSCLDTTRLKLQPMKSSLNDYSAKISRVLSHEKTINDILNLKFKSILSEEPVYSNFEESCINAISYYKA